MSTDGLVSVERRDHVAIISLQRVEALNAISGAMAVAISDAYSAVSADDDVWVVVLRAEGEKAFCVGADLKERASLTLDQFYENRKQLRGMFATIRKTPQPTIAAVFGFALGGGFELALSCDIVIAAEGTELGLPEARVGLLPAGGGTQLLTRAVGTRRAKELIFRGRRFPESDALAWGLVAQVVPRADLDQAAAKMAEEVCGSSPIALRAAKVAIDAALGTELDRGLEIEEGAWATVIRSEDRAEGIAAFNEKRAPNWSNR